MPPACNENLIFHLAASLRAQANALISELLAQQGVHDILPAHGAVLAALFAYGPLPMGKIAEHIDRKKNTVTSLIKTLEERGYCQRQPSPADARVQLVALTAKGMGLRPLQEAISRQLVARAWAGIAVKERQACVRALNRALKNMQDDD